MRMKLIALACLVALAGCTSIPVQVMRAYHDSVGASYMKYVDEDKLLSEEQKRIRKQPVLSMERLLQAAEK